MNKKQPHSKPINKAALNPLSFFYRHRLIAFMVFIAAFILYSNTLKFDYALDDGIYTTKNPIIQNEEFSKIFTKGSLYGFDGTNHSQYRPLRFSIF